MRYGATHRGFESRPLRHFAFVTGTARPPARPEAMSRHRPVLILTLGVVITLAACAAPGAPSASPSSPPGSGSPSAAASPAPLDRIPVANAMQRDGVTLTIQVDAGQVLSGDRIRLLVTAT